MKLVVLLLLAASCGSTRVVDRADGGAPILLGGSQPSADTLVRLHRRYGIRTVVNLRGERPDEAWFRSEARGVAAIGARWIHLRTDGARAQSPEQVARFRAIVEDPANWPVFLHCEGGVHRTGIWLAYYRVRYQGWAPEYALAEMDRNGFRWGRRDRSAARAWVAGLAPATSSPAASPSGAPRRGSR